MGALAKLKNSVTTLTELAEIPRPDAWTSSSDASRRKATAVGMLVHGQDARIGAMALAESLHQQILAGMAGAVEYAMLVSAAAQAGWLKNGELVSAVTLKRAILAHRKGGRVSLLDKRAGRTRKPQAWDTRAAYLWANPSKRSYSGIAFQLRSEGHDDATESKVARYIKSLPATISSPQSPARIGKHLHKLNRQHFTRRNTDELLVGEMFAGDGHTCDAYMAHPNTGGIFRPELTVFIDIKSRYLVGWWLSESETKESTLFALSSAMTTYDHVPAWLYLDHGAGYRAMLMSDESTGFYAKFDISTTAALPGNANGKGWVERWFRTFRDLHDKFFADGMMYCGDDMAPEVNRRLSVDVKTGKRKLPSYKQYQESVTAFIERYNNEPMDIHGRRSPAEVWAELNPVPVGTEFDAVMRPRVERTVGHQEVRLDNRHYYAEVLAEHDGKKVHVEYDLHNDRLVWVRDTKGCLICVAELVHTIGVLPTSRIEEGRDRRERGQVKRLQLKLDEVAKRRIDPVEAGSQMEAIESLQTTALPNPAPNPSASAADDFVIDITNWRNT